MQWTTRKLYKIFTIRCTILALSCVLFLGISPPAVASNLTNDVAQINVTVDLINDYLQQTLQTSLATWNQQIHNDLLGIDSTGDLSKIMAILSGRTLSQTQTWSDTDNIRTYLKELTRFVSGSDAPQSTVVGSSTGLWQTQRDALTQLQKLNVSLRAVSNYLASASGSGTNIYNIKVDARDILAGNPWWASNSAFALTFNQYSKSYPSEYPNTGTTYSFPQFLSRWSAMMTLPGNGQGQIANNTLKRDWWRYFGSLSRTADAGDSYPYTWFDWMSDAMRSNFVLQSSAIDSASMDADYIVNHLDLLIDSLSSSEFFAYSNYLASSSNLVLVSENVSSNELTQFAEADLTADDELPSTNGLASLTLSEGSIDGNPFENFEDNLELLLPSFGRGSPNMVVIPEMTIGGVHVPIGQADFLSLSSGTVSPIPAFQAFIGGFCRWLWRFCCFVGIFFIVKQEWDYWSTLGGSASG